MYWGRHMQPLFFEVFRLISVNWRDVQCIGAVGSRSGNMIAMCIESHDDPRPCYLVVISRFHFLNRNFDHCRTMLLRVRDRRSFSMTFVTDDVVLFTHDHILKKFDSGARTAANVHDEVTPWARELAEMTPEAQRFHREERPETAFLLLSGNEVMKEVVFSIYGRLYFVQFLLNSGNINFGTSSLLDLGNTGRSPVAQMAPISQRSVLLWDGYSVFSLVNIHTRRVRLHMPSPVSGPGRRIVLCGMHSVRSGVCVSIRSDDHEMASMQLVNTTVWRHMLYRDKAFFRALFCREMHRRALLRGAAGDAACQRGLSGLFYGFKELFDRILDFTGWL